MEGSLKAPSRLPGISRTNLRCADRPKRFKPTRARRRLRGNLVEESEIVATWSGFAPAERVRETLELPDGSEGGRLLIGAWAGSVNVSAGRRGVVEVALRCRGLLPPPALEIERAGEDVYVEARSAPILRWLAPWAWREVWLDVSVPTRYSVDVVTSRGSIAIRDVDGEVSAYTASG